VEGRGATAVGSQAPASPRELVDPRWRGRIASAYPNDDDATLFLFKRYTEAYGWPWIAQLAEQQLSFARGSHTPGVAVAEGRKALGVGGSGDPRATGATRWIVPAKDPFMADRAEVERWRQTFSLYFGEVVGAPTPGWLGLHPGR